MGGKLVCDRCALTYTDDASIQSAVKDADEWRKLCAEDGDVARGICPCPNLQCDGELILKSK